MPWLVISEFLQMQQKIYCQLQFIKMHSKFLCENEKQQFFNECQQAYMNLKMLDELFLQLGAVSLPITPQNMLDAFTKLATIFISKQYLNCIIKVFCYSAGRFDRIKNQASHSQSSNVYIANRFFNLLNNLNTHVASSAVFFINWCDAIAAFCQEQQLVITDSLKEIRLQLKCLSQVYDDTFIHGTDILKKQITNMPLNDNLLEDESSGATKSPSASGPRVPLVAAPHSSPPPTPSSPPPPLPSSAPPPLSVSASLLRKGDVPLPPTSHPSAASSLSPSATRTASAATLSTPPSSFFQAPPPPPPPPILSSVTALAPRFFVNSSSRQTTTISCIR